MSALVSLTLTVAGVVYLGCGIATLKLCYKAWGPPPRPSWAVWPIHALGLLLTVLLWPLALRDLIR